MPNRKHVGASAGFEKKGLILATEEVLRHAETPAVFTWLIAAAEVLTTHTGIDAQDISITHEDLGKIHRDHFDGNIIALGMAASLNIRLRLNADSQSPTSSMVAVTQYPDGAKDLGLYTFSKVTTKLIEEKRSFLVALFDLVGNEQVHTFFKNDVKAPVQNGRLFMRFSDEKSRPSLH